MRNTLFIVSLYLILSACGEKSNEVKFISEGNPIVVTMRLKKDRTLT